MVHSALEWDDFQEIVHIIDDPRSGAKGVVVVHSTALGPAVGGCRLAPYSSDAALMRDAMRLAREMTYKNALAGLPFGGGKAVLLQPEAPFDRAALFRAVGESLELLEGRYIAVQEVGTDIADMQNIAKRTSYVAGLDRKARRAGGDPSPWTALGVFKAMELAHFHLHGRSLAGARVAVQGVGRVGQILCELLSVAGARLIVADTNHRRAQAIAERFRAQILSADAILSAEADILAPCAVGGVLNCNSIAAIRAPLICGAANSQLAHKEDGEELRARGIAYAPDYVVNAGGMINIAAEHRGASQQMVRRDIDAIAERVIMVFAESDRRSIATNRAADAMAREIIGKPSSWAA